MTHLIASILFQVVFSGVTIQGGVSVSASTAEIPAPSDCSIVAQAAWDAAALPWLPFELAAGSQAEGDGCPAASMVLEDLSF